MLTIECPTCGRRDGLEFVYSGDASGDRTAPAGDITAWRHYLYFHPNRPDWTRELWLHVAGCGRFFPLERHRTTNEIRQAITASLDGGGVEI